VGNFEIVPLFPVDPSKSEKVGEIKRGNWIIQYLSFRKIRNHWFEVNPEY
jgi:hypothetical protein